MNVGFDTRKENLLCHMVLDDTWAELMGMPSVAFWRAFIVENRETHEVSANFRFRYPSGKDSWYHVTPKNQDQSDRMAITGTLAAELEGMLYLALQKMFGLEGMAARVLVGAVDCFYPPEPDDPQKTMQYLLDQDLIEIKRVEVP
jgi:hypothetical protein